MGSLAPQPAETLVQLVLRAHHIDEIVQTDEDWRALGLIAARTLFWCGGAIYACRSEADEMRFALQLFNAPLGNYAHQITTSYAAHLRKTRGVDGSIFRHYAAIPLPDDLFLDELVLWLHRPSGPAGSSLTASGASTAAARIRRVWTTEDAYLAPNSMLWVSTDRVLRALSVGAPGPASYRRRKSEEIPSEVVQIFTRRPPRPRSRDSLGDFAADYGDANRATRSTRPNIETVTRFVASYCRVPYEEMLGDTRKRAVSKARVIATVLATRNGATAAALARLFNRARSTLSEQVEHYRVTQPAIFVEAETALEASIASRNR